MNTLEKQTLNLVRYGDPNPSLIKRLRSSIFGNGLLINQTNTENFWTALYSYSKATKKELVNQGYGQNVTVYAAINKIARKASQSQWGIYTVKDVRAYEKYKALQKQPYSLKQQMAVNIAKEQALKPHPGHYLEEKFQNPNEQQSGAEYMENLLGMKLLTGDSYEMADMTDKGKIGAFWVLPSQNIKILTDAYGKFPMFERGYEMEFGSSLIRYKPEEVCHSRYWQPVHNGDGSHLYGMSPLDAAWLNALQDNNAREAAVELLKNRGTRGIFTFESEVIKEYTQFQEAKGKIKEEWSQNTKEYKDKITPMFGKGQFHSIGLSAKDLAILELCKMNKDDICNAYGFNSILLNNNEHSTLDNYVNASKELITGCVLPLLGTIRDARNRKLKGDWNPKTEKIVCDFDPTIYTELDADKEKLVKWMRGAEAFTDNEIRIQCNYEKLENAMHDEVWKKTNSVPTSMINEQTLSRNTQSNGQADN